MEDWSDWVSISDPKDLKKSFAFHGVYMIRCVDASGDPIPIGRLVATDEQGVLYIGRSGLPSKSPQRTVAHRLNEFSKYRHSGGKTYFLASISMEREESFPDYSLQARGRHFLEEDIERGEDHELTQYLMRHGELPPCNSKMPAVKAALYGKKPRWSA